MKKIIILLALVIAGFFQAQVIIGDAIGNIVSDKSSVLLEFPAGQNKGIIVPYVRTLPVGAALVGGSIILDARSVTTARMRFYNDTSWVDLSGQDGDVTLALSIQPTIAVAPEDTTSKAIIGATTSTADGVLVLESTSKAMVLPIVAKVDDIPSPSPGMMVYVNKTGAKRFAVYNGSKWSFFKP